MIESVGINKLGGVGASQIGKLFTKDGLKAKTAQSFALEKAEELYYGYPKELTTIAMQHGIFNEEEAFDLVVKPSFPNAIYQSSESILIDSFGHSSCWATPDVIDYVEGIDIDIKCPYTITTYNENVRKLPETYIAQNQMQMLATGHKKGFVCIYLTSNSVDEWGNKIEYKIDINKRHTFIPISADESFQSEILKRIEEFLKIRDLIFKDISNAIKISDEEYFEMVMGQGKKATRFKDKSNLLTWGGKIYKNQREGFLVIE